MKLLKSITLLFAITFCIPLLVFAEKHPMSFEQLIAWKRITEQAISDNGEWVACKMEPWRGDSKVLIYNKKGEQIAEIPVGSKLFFTSSSNYLLLTQSPALELMEEAKLKK